MGIFFLSAQPLLQVGCHMPYLGHGYGIAKLAVGLRIADRNAERAIPLIKTHHARAFTRREPARIATIGLPDQDFSPILVIPCGERPRYIVGTAQTITKPVTTTAMFIRVSSQIFPQVIRQRIFGPHHSQQSFRIGRFRFLCPVFGMQNG